MSESDYKKTLLEILDKIRETNENLKLEDPVPTQDDLYRNILGGLVNDRKELAGYLATLVESHHLFAIKIVEADENLMIDGLTGYVIAEVGIVKKLKDKYKNLLETAYEHQFYQRKHYVNILKELIREARRFNNTPFGKCLNVSHMLEQFAQIFAADFNEYSETWKANRLEEILSSRAYAGGKSEEGEGAGQGAAPPLVSEYGMDDDGLPEESSAAPAPAPAASETDMDHDFAEAPSGGHPGGRATDTPEFMKVQEMDRSGKWGSAVDKFGVQFLLRIHFRKYEFEKVRFLLKSHKVAREEDLRFVRDTLRLMESRTGIDPELNKHMTKMTELRRMAQLRLNQIQILKKKS